MYKIAEPILIVINMLLPLIIALPLCLSSFVIMAIVKAYKNNENEVKTIVSIKEVALLVLLNYIPAILVVITYNISSILVLLLGVLYSAIITFVTLFNTKVITKNVVLVFINLHLLVLNSIAVWFSALAQESSDAEANMIMSLILYILLLVNVITIVGTTIFGVRNRGKIVGFINNKSNKKIEAKKNKENQKKVSKERKKSERLKINNNQGTLQEKMLYAYIGKNASKILTSRVNIPAALLGPVWYFYRKSYRYAIIFSLIYLVPELLPITLFSIGAEVLSQTGVFFDVLIVPLILLFILPILVVLITPLVNLFAANKFYKCDIKRKIEEIKLEDSDELEENMKNKGGTKLSHAIIAFITLFISKYLILCFVVDWLVSGFAAR